MRTTIAIVLGLVALAALVPLMASIVQVSGKAAQRRSVSVPLTATAVFAMMFLVTSCSASIIASTGE
jgi:hypothetical protein